MSFCFFNSSKKRTKDFCPSRLGQKLEFSSSFFGRIESTKRTFRNKLTFSSTQVYLLTSICYLLTYCYDNYVLQWWVEFNDELNSTMSWVGCLLKYLQQKIAKSFSKFLLFPFSQLSCSTKSVSEQPIKSSLNSTRHYGT